MTTEERKDIIDGVLAEIKSSSQDVTELESVTTLDGVESLPAMKGNTLVSAPVSLLSKPAEDAAAKADKATKSAGAAAGQATEAAQAAVTATTNANKATTEANAATQAATAAAQKVDDAVAKADEVSAQYKIMATTAINGATARFDELVEDVDIKSTSFVSISGVAYDISKKVFCAKVSDGVYCNNWETADLYLNEARTEILKDKVYICGEAAYVWSNDEDNLVEISGSGGGNTYNVTNEVPIELGYYTLATAIAAVDEKHRMLGRCITFEASAGKWVTKQFIGTSLDSWEQAESWEDFGGAGTVKSISVNGVKQTLDESGNVSINIDETEVDESLNTESTNPVQNKVVAQKIAELEENTLRSLEVVPNGDENYLYAYNSKGKEIANTKLPAGGGGGGSSSTSRIIVTASVSPDMIKEGDSSLLTYTYDHVNADNESDGVKATLTVTVKLGTTVLLEKATRNVAKGTYEVDLTQYMKTAGVVDIYVKAECTTAEGEKQTKQAYASVTVVGMSLTSEYDVSTALSRGGYDTGETINIPFTLTGSGTRTVSMYVDGSAVPVTKTVTKSGTTRDSFIIQAGSLTPGRHSVQLLAERDGIKSDVIWIDLLRKGADAPYVGIMFADSKGNVVTGDMPIVPTLTAKQYDSLSFTYAAYDPKSVPATVKETQVTDGGATTTREFSVGRGKQDYSNRFLSQGTVTVTMACGSANTVFKVGVEASGLDISEATQNLVLKLSATGRSNSESAETRQTWSDRGHSTTFEGVDWATSGWQDNALVLKNGAKAVVDYKPFLTDIKQGGCTVEIEMMVNNISDRDSVVVDCMENNVKGFRITAQTAMLYSGSTKEQEDEENLDPDTGRPLVTSVPVGVERTFSESTRVRITFVVGKKSDGQLMQLYMNGDRCSAMCYQEDDNFQQDTPQDITISSDGADVYVYGIRAYSQPLTDDEVVDNYIVDRETPDAMATAYQNNNVLNAETGEIDINSILSRGHAAIFIVRSDDSGDGLADVNACKNKKQNFHVDELTIYTPWGDTIRYVNVMMRIQGTSSTKYPVKNFRFYWAKTAKEGLTPEMYVNGEKQDSQKLPLYSGDQHPCKVSCAKADFSDSSMKTNTGQANLFNDILKDLCPTPPQQEDPSVRSCIYGYPCDIFAATKADEAHPTYYGQYQMNHDKSDWYDVTGMTDKGKHIALEFLDNGKKLCNFQVDDDIDTQLDEEFASSYEFNYPKDTLWSGADTEGGETNASDYQKTAIKTMLSWIKACVPAGADMTCKDLSTWQSSAFKTGLPQHFNLKNLLYWYLLTEYDAMVDQRAKNTIWRTWDGLIWYVTYYDGDTCFGKRNDSMLKYLYNVARDSYDTEKRKWVFEGHDSWLWCMLLANYGDELKTAAEELRRVFTNTKLLKTYDDIQANWSQREYNKSGEMKYITPETKGVRVTENGVTTDGNKFYYMYALSGNREMQLKHFITNRFALLDARFGVSTYRADSAGFYLAREVSDPADTIKITSSDEYYFAYGLSGKDYMEGETGRLLRGEQGTLSVTGKRALNDPMLLFGASRMLELDMTGAATHLLNGLELGNCKALRKLDLSVTSGSGSKTTWWLVTDGCRQLREVNLYGQANARSNRNDSTTLDFSSQTLLEKLDARGTKVKSVSIAKGAPVDELKLPATLTTLRLEYLPKLTADGLILEGYDNISTLIFEQCPGLDWQEIYAQCDNLQSLRVVGIDMDGNGSDLVAMMERGLKGVDADGTAVDHAVITGTYRLTQYMDEDEYARLTAWYGDELSIRQPECTVIKFDDRVSASANISNLDNHTGYDYGNAYKPSGHISLILSHRHRVLAKKTAEGEVTVCQLHDQNSNYFADAADVAKATPAKLTGEMGDVMMLEPHYWYKGVNDLLNKAKYACYSFNTDCPAPAESRKVTLGEMTVKAGYAVRISEQYTTLAEAEVASAANSYVTVNVQGYRQVRWPSLQSAAYGAVMLNANGEIVKRMKSMSDSGIREGDYCYTAIPDGAVTLAFTIVAAAPFDYVLLTMSDKPEDIEPDWVEHTLCLGGVYEAQVTDDIVRSVSGVQSTGNMNIVDFKTYVSNRGKGYQLIDWELHKDVGNLFFAKYGERDSQGTCGPGTHTVGRATGASDSTGMQDTKATAKDGDTPPSVSDNYYPNANAYVLKNKDDEKRTAIGSPVCMGYENWYGNKAEWMLADFCKTTVDYIWRVPMPDGTERQIQGIKQGGDLYPKSVIHGRHMDTLASYPGGSQTSCYYDDCYQNPTVGRVVFRSCNYAAASGGVSYAFAVYDSASVFADIGSRLAFRGVVRTDQIANAFVSSKEQA